MNKTEIKQDIINNLEVLNLKDQMEVASQILDNITMSLYCDGYIEESNFFNDIMNRLENTKKAIKKECIR